MLSNKNFAIVLTAGQSKRMGTCKAGLPWCDGHTLLTYQTHQWLMAGVIPIVVLGPHNKHQQENCPYGCQVVINPDPNRGKTSSVLLGLQALSPKFRNVIISAVDQPRPQLIYQMLLQSHEQHRAAITVPSYGNRMGHPTIFSQSMLPQLMLIREETQGLRQLVHQCKAHLHQLEFRTMNVLMDLNTPEVYQAHRLEFIVPTTESCYS
ncbi:nucleotidyltransferase family protein [Phormidium tenue FACHB-886]|nr:nucleotidyltransferase family protein [Phormidium tenue FACHB-886]